MSDKSVKYYMADDGQTIMVDGMEEQAETWLKAKKAKSRAEKTLGKLSGAFKKTALSVFGRLAGAGNGGCAAVRVSFQDAEGDASVLVSLPDMEKKGNIRELSGDQVQAVKDAMMWNCDLLRTETIGAAPATLTVTGELAEKLYEKMSLEDKSLDDVTYMEKSEGRTAYYLQASARQLIHSKAAEGDELAEMLLKAGLNSPSIKVGK